MAHRSLQLVTPRCSKHRRCAAGVPYLSVCDAPFDWLAVDSLDNAFQLHHVAAAVVPEAIRCGVAFCCRPFWSSSQETLHSDRSPARRAIEDLGHRGEELEGCGDAVRRRRGVDRGDGKEKGAARCGLNRCSHPRSPRSQGDRIMTTRAGNLRGQRCGS